VVAGLVTPDRFRLSRSGVLLEQTLGAKELRVGIVDGASQELDTSAAEQARFCLAAAELGALHALTLQVDRLWAGPHDLEFAFAG